MWEGISVDLCNGCLAILGPKLYCSNMLRPARWDLLEILEENIRDLEVSVRATKALQNERKGRMLGEKVSEAL